MALLPLLCGYQIKCSLPGNMYVPHKGQLPSPTILCLYSTLVHYMYSFRTFLAAFLLYPPLCNVISELPHIGFFFASL